MQLQLDILGHTFVWAFVSGPSKMDEDEEALVHDVSSSEMGFQLQD